MRESLTAFWRSKLAPALISASTIAVWPSRAALMRAVEPRQPWRSRFAPALISALTIAVWQSMAALMRAVSLQSSWRSRLAPALISALTIAVWPWMAALMRAVPPYPSRVSMWAPRARMSRTLWRSPPWAVATSSLDALAWEAQRSDEKSQKGGAKEDNSVKRSPAQEGA